MHAIESPDAAERFIKTHVCAVCGKGLSVAWGGGFGLDSWIIRCSRNPKHEGMERTGGSVSTDIKKYEPAQALQVFEKRWGALATNQRDAEVVKLFDLVDLGFDPVLHLQLYQGRVTTTIDGMYWWVSGHPKFERITSEPIGADLKAAYGLGADDIGVIAKLYVAGLKEPYCTGFGKANMKTDRNPVSKDHPYRMAEKRAEAQAIRKLRPIGVQVYTPEDVVEGEVVDTSTGEIEPPPAAPAAPAAPAKLSPQAPAAESPLQVMNRRAIALAGKRGLTADELKAWCNDAANKAFPSAGMTWANAGIMEKNAALDVFEKSYAPQEQK